MRIELFKNGKGLIHGENARRISCGMGGMLRIGTAEVKLLPQAEEIMPLLFNGASGIYNATFTADVGLVYQLARVTVKGGRIVSPSQTDIELMELRCRADSLEDRCDELEKKVLELQNIFDTNSLNFIIKGEETK